MASFQARIFEWGWTCFGRAPVIDRKERNHRFLEEALELVQAIGLTREESHMLVDFVFDRPVGEPHQGIGDVMVTLALLCSANGFDMLKAGETELTRIWKKMDAIRAKRATKPELMA